MRTDLKMIQKWRIAAAFFVAVGLSACGSASDISVRNPNFVGVSLKDGVLFGSYNPAGFDAQLIQNQIKSLCTDKALGGYSERPGEQGLVAFSATCADGTTFRRAFMEIERMPNGNFSVEVTGS